ncbi:MAG: hypothetical protein R3A12_19345 [Ignavibacteria bacterium]
MYDGKFLESRSVIKFMNNVFKENIKLVKQDNDHQLDFIINGVKVTFFTNDAVNITFDVKDHSVSFNEMNMGYRYYFDFKKLIPLLKEILSGIIMTFII